MIWLWLLACQGDTKIRPEHIVPGEDTAWAEVSDTGADTGAYTSAYTGSDTSANTGTGSG